MFGVLILWMKTWLVVYEISLLEVVYDCFPSGLGNFVVFGLIHGFLLTVYFSFKRIHVYKRAVEALVYPASGNVQQAMCYITVSH